LAGEAEKPAFRIAPLGLNHDRAAFSCGVNLLDLYLRKQTGQDFKKHAAVPFVLTPDGSTIAGYYTLSQYAVQLDNVPAEVAKKLPRYPLVPTTLVGRLAVRIDFRGQGHRETLLMDALHRILQHSQGRLFAGTRVDCDGKRQSRTVLTIWLTEILPEVFRRLGQVG
jgi:hypothetical protein